MPFKTSTLLVTLLFLAVAWPSMAPAQQETRPIHPWYSNARFQVGNGLPMPITFTPPPRGRVRPPALLTVQQGTVPATTATTLPSGRSIAMAATRMTAPGNKIDYLVWVYGSPVQLNTSISVQWPGSAATFQAGGRTGPPAVTFCAGQTVTTNYNPACTGPGAAGNLINGLMRYTKTANQFGGAAQGAFGGGMDMGFRAAGGLPCDYATGACMVMFVHADPAPTQPTGGPFGFSRTTPGNPPNPGLFNARVTAAGWITYITPTGLGAGMANSATSFGGPWTTGRLTVSVTAASPPEIFTITGSDTRVAGQGMISLVSGALSQRSGGNPSAHRGWVSLYVPEPGTMLGVVAALLTLATCHGLLRRRSRGRARQGAGGRAWSCRR